MPDDLSSTAVATMEPPDGKVPVVQFEDVSIAFEGKPVLKEITFSVERGETLSSLARRAAAIGAAEARERAARARLAARSASSARRSTDCGERELYALRARIGMVFQESALFDSLTVEDNVAYRLHEEHVPEAEAHARVVEALQFVELEARSTSSPPTFRRDAPSRSIARAISPPRPDPLRLAHRRARPHHLDHHHRAGDEAARRSHTTSLMVTHRLQDAFILAANRFDPATNSMKPLPRAGADAGIDEGMKFLLLNEGKIAFHGTTEELVGSGHPWVKRYLE